MAVKKKAPTPKKAPQAPPDYRGLTPRHCAGCRAPIRTRRQRRCKPCTREAEQSVTPVEVMERRDAKARELGFADWYDWTDS